MVFRVARLLCSIFTCMWCRSVGFSNHFFFLAVGFLMCMQVTCFGCMCVIILSFLVFLGVDAQINVRVIARVH